jgi:hypothetical protein
MNGKKRYDGDLQMFCDEPHEPDLRKLIFMRWLVEHNRFEHGAMGPSSGPYSLLTDSNNSTSTAHLIDPTVTDKPRTTFWSGTE